MQLRIATCASLPEPDPDQELLLGALRRAGIEAELCAWDSPAVRWEESIPTVIRSTWNYYEQPARFLGWCELVERAAPLWNELSAIRWNLNKHYLETLAKEGVATVPTIFFKAATAESLARTMKARSWERFVVKPAVSAASFGTRRFEARELEQAREHLALLVARGDAMVQPYLDSVERYGERSLVFIDGVFSHAVRKAPRFAGEEELVTGPLEVAPDELQLAERALAGRPSNLLYARVDLCRDGTGRPLVAELELIEPSLFLTQSPPALERLTAALGRRLRNAATRTHSTSRAV